METTNALLVAVATMFTSVYIRSAAVDELLSCQRKPVKSHGKYAVAVKKNGTIIGHLPRRISKVCRGTISCRVSGPRRYSDDLPSFLGYTCIREQGHGVWTAALTRARKMASDRNNFRVKNFRSSEGLRKYFNKQNFPIYGSTQDSTQDMQCTPRGLHFSRLEIIMPE